MTPEQKAEYDLLKLCNDQGKLPIEIGGIIGMDAQFALERLQIRRWITLIDVSPISEYPGKIFRMFLASDVAMRWFGEQG
jgi:hypothetical protein